LLRAWQLRIGPIEGRRAAAAVSPHCHRRSAGFLTARGAGLARLLDGRQSITLAGDTQQHIVKDAGFTSWSAFFKDLGLEGTEVTTLE